MWLLSHWPEVNMSVSLISTFQGGWWRKCVFVYLFSSSSHHPTVKSYLKCLVCDIRVTETSVGFSVFLLAHSVSSCSIILAPLPVLETESAKKILRVLTLSMQRTDTYPLLTSPVHLAHTVRNMKWVTAGIVSTVTLNIWITGLGAAADCNSLEINTESTVMPYSWPVAQ